ncbi:MAG: MoaD/ThiS family protein [Novosphingobium sp.]|uniref:MoaD/ThiS family protein n=1 Tax=Novosphingobium sp. TaxID=1874826 RepID=UPI001D8146A6|nr:MoaD/ThiS family protein [Novosphingobium sp.]MCB2015135.1 MoaD/ThiS family protein [Sphingobium sp.]MCP5386851.1 MoaD/ThiS family protein [Novosphingobium sp.]
MTEVQIELCGRLADQLGRQISAVVPDRGLAVEGLLATLSTTFPPLEVPIASGRIKVCVNDEIVSQDYVVQPQDEVALFPPVSGG